MRTQSISNSYNKIRNETNSDARQAYKFESEHIDNFENINNLITSTQSPSPALILTPAHAPAQALIQEQAPEQAPNQQIINNTNTHSTTQTNVMNKIKNSNKKIENIALGFITSIILCFVAVIYNSTRHIKK